MKIELGIDQRDILFQEIVVYDKEGVIKGSFYAARHYGERSTWVQHDVFSPAVQKLAAKELATRFALFDGHPVKIISTEWLRERFADQIDQRLARILDACEEALTKDNSRGQLVGKMIFQKPTAS
jgi:hypothetical protein